jgi:DUF971 family protein
MNVYPTHLELTVDNQLQITWNDGQTRRYTCAELRDSCPCATCREKHGAQGDGPAGGLPVISLDEAQPLKIQTMKPVGNYAYSIVFSDGHDSGIYTFELLLTLGCEMSGQDE